MYRKYKYLYLIASIILIGCADNDSDIRIKAAKGDIKAQYLLATWYDNGSKEGIPKNHIKSAYWYSKAAEQGDAKSQHNLAKKYESGDGVTIDFNKAVYWHNKSAAQGHTPAQFSLSRIYADTDRNLYNGQKALFWMTKAAENGNSTAQFILGRWYSEGQFTEKNFYLAYIWFDIANKYDSYEYIAFEKHKAESKLTSEQLKKAREASYKWEKGQKINSENH